MEVYLVLMDALQGWRRTEYGVTETWVNPVHGREWMVRLNLVMDTLEVFAPDGRRQSMLFDPKPAEVVGALADRGVPVRVGVAS